MSETAKPSAGARSQPAPPDDDVTLAAWPRTAAAPGGRHSDPEVVRFAIEHQEDMAGSVEVRRLGDGVGRLTWVVDPRHRHRGVATRAVRLLIDYCLGELGLERVEAAVEVDDLASLRTAGRAGLRREGVVRAARTAEGRRRDFVLLARLRDDPPPSAPEGFRAVLNAALPRKRLITQGLIRSDQGHVLLCELTYKAEWDLPGGVVDPGEPPSLGLARELGEELGLSLPIHGLSLVDWLPPWRGWDDACLFIFDLGVHPMSLTSALDLEAREIRAVHWATPSEAVEQVAPYLAALLPALLEPGVGPAYLEAGLRLT